MSWIAVLLIGVAVTDLAHSIKPIPLVNTCIGAAVAVWAGLIAGLTEPADLVALAVIAGVVGLWGYTVAGAVGRGRAWLPLLVLGAALTTGARPRRGPAGGLLGEWLESANIPALQGVSADRALLLVGIFLVQLSTGNVIVRLVLAATNTTDPTYGSEPDPEQRLQGGRLLGPMERVFIVGLGLAGNLIAASIVIAAKGLLRFPELQSKGEQVRIHRLTEYFLVGSFRQLAGGAGLARTAGHLINQRERSAPGEHDHGERPVGDLLVRRELAPVRAVADREQPVVPRVARTKGYGGGRPAAQAHLHLDVRVGLEVEQPGRWLSMAAVGGDDHEPVAVLAVHECVGAGCPLLRPVVRSISAGIPSRIR